MMGQQRDRANTQQQDEGAFDNESFKEMQDKVSEVPASHRETIIDEVQCNDGIM
jgi:hypothetical protein